MNNRFFTTYGIEFSYLVPEQFTQDQINEHDLTEMYVQMFRKEVKKQFKGKKFNHMDIHDDEVIEIAGPYFKGYGEMKKFYTGLAKVAERLKTPTHRYDTGGGGGHIHAGIPKDLEGEKLLLFVANVSRDINNRPYLNYIFNEYNDDINAYHMSLKYSWSSNPYLDPNIKTAKELTDKYLAYRSSYCYGDPTERRKEALTKKRILRSFSNAETYMNAQSDYDTLEFRIFDAVYSEEQLESHVNFLNQYLKYIWAITQKGELVQSKFKTKNGAKVLCQSYKDIVKTRREFKAFLNTLDLDYNNYKALFKRNYLERLHNEYNFN